MILPRSFLTATALTLVKSSGLLGAKIFHRWGCQTLARRNFRTKEANRRWISCGVQRRLPTRAIAALAIASSPRQNRASIPDLAV
jgi:hypothetical protein